MELPLRPLTPDAFAPFGRVVAHPEGDPDAEGTGFRWWAETALMPGDGRAMGVGYLDLQPGTRTFDWAERHLRTPEAVFATTVDLLLYVGPPEHVDEPLRPPSLDRFQVFEIPAGSGVVMDPAVWHGAPFAVDRPGSAIVLIAEGTGRTDVSKVTFDAVDIGDARGMARG